MVRGKSISVVVVALAGLFLAGCGSGGKTQLRALQASPNEPTTLDVLLDGKTLFSGLALGAPTAYSSVSSGTRHLQVELTGSTTPVIDEDISLSGGNSFTLITADFPASLTPILLTDSKTAPSSGDAQIRVVNAGAGAGNVDVYITTPGNTPGVVQPTLSSLAFGSSSDYISETGGSYEIFFTVSGSTFQYVDTGSQTFGSGQNRTVVMVPSVFGGYTYVILSDLN
jgi:Domain of unknown function (DUF4397)